jgi:tetratricopeptide (TPR) repeat protein
LTQIVLQLAKQLKHLEWQCLALLNLCAGYKQLKDYKQARQLNEEALFISKQLGHREWICFSLLAQGALSIRWKSYDQAEASLQEALTLAREIEKPLYECQILEYLGDLALGCQHVESAEDFFSEMMRKIPEGLFALKAEAMYRLGLVAAAKQEFQQAKMLGEEAVRILDELGNKSLAEVRNWVAMDCPPFLPESFTALEQ